MTTIVRTNSFWRRLLLSCSLAVVAALPAWADVPSDPAARQKIVGQPTGLAVLPAKITLAGPRSTAQIVVNGL